MTPKPPRFQTLRVLGALMIREMITKYGRSWGGYAWAILEPVGMIAILSLAFSQFIRTPPIGHSFVLFYATGYLPFHFFSEIANSTSTSISVNRPLMHLPMITLLDAILARFFLSLLTLIVVSTIVIGTMPFLVADAVRLDVPIVLISMAAGSILGLGVGTMNSVLFAYIPSWQPIWAIINRPLFIISGVFFTYESMPTHIQNILWWNPLIHVVGQARRGFYPTYEGTYVSYIFLFGVALVCSLLGLPFLPETAVS